MLPCRQIREQIGVAETVNGLFRVADHEYRGILPVINRRENRILERVGILKFVDQRGGKTLADRIGQPVHVRIVQGIVQIREHVVERDRAALAFFRFQVFGCLIQKTPHQSIACSLELRLQFTATRIQRIGKIEKRMLGRYELRLGLALNPGRHHHDSTVVMTEHEQAIVRGEQTFIFTERLADTGEFLVRVFQCSIAATFLKQRPDSLFFSSPAAGRCRIRRLKLRESRRDGLRRHIRRLHIRPAQIGQRFFHALPQQRFQRVRRKAGRLDPARQGRRKIAAGDICTPEIIDRFAYQLGIVRFGIHRKRLTRRKRRQRQRTLAKTVDRENRRLIERLERQLQQAGKFLTRQAVCHAPLQQLRDEGIVCIRCIRCQRSQRIGDAVADTLAQFVGRRLCERHHQNLADRQFLFQQQAQVQIADIPCLAGTGGSLDDRTAIQRTVQYVELSCHRHAFSPLQRVKSSPKTRRARSGKASSASGSALPRIASRLYKSSLSPS